MPDRTSRSSTPGGARDPRGADASPSRSTRGHRRRSVRLALATALVVLAAACVAGGAVIGSVAAAVAAGVVAVVLGAVATGLVRAEVARCRHEAAVDRTRQAVAAAEHAAARSAEHRAVVASLAGGLARTREELEASQLSLAGAARDLHASQQQARRARDRSRRTDLHRRLELEDLRAEVAALQHELARERSATRPTVAGSLAPDPAWSRRRPA